jgi:CHAT domain-containing protein/Flp pilus assembly protein TadD
MKKNISVCAFLLFAFSGFGQVVDTAWVVREVDSLLLIVDRLNKKNQLKEALSAGEMTLEFINSKLGIENTWYAHCQQSLGIISYKSGNLKIAEQYFSTASFLRKKNLGENSADYISSVSNLAIVYWRTGRFNQAESIYLEILSIREKTIGKNNPDYASTLINLGLVYWKSGRFEEAERLYEIARIIFEDEIKNTKHPFYVNCINNLGALYFDMCRFEEAERYIKAVLKLKEEIYGKETFHYATSLTNLAGLYQLINQLRLAESLYLQANEIYLKTSTNEHPDGINNLSNLASVYILEEQFDKAQEYMEEATRLNEKTLGKDNPDYADNLFNLGILFLKAHKYNEAESIFIRAKNIFEINYNNQTHPHYISCLNEIARMYYKNNQFDKAGIVFKQMETYQSQVKLTENLVNVNFMSDFATFLWKTGEHESGFNKLEAAMNIQRNMLLRGTRYLSEYELENYYQLFEKNIDHSLAFLINNELVRSQKSSFAYDNILLYKGFLLMTSSQIRKFAQSQPELYKEYLLLISYYRRLSNEYTKNTIEVEKIKEIEDQTNILEKELIQKIAGLKEVIRQYNWKEVQLALRPNEAAIEFIHFKYYNPEPTDSILYAALLLKPGMQQPMFIPLCEEKQLRALLPAAEGKLNNDQVNELYSNSALYHLLWSPLESQLTDIRKVYYSPSGLLHRLNLSALPTSPKTVLSNRHDMVSLGSTRQLALDNQRVASIEAPTALIYGGIQFDLDSTVYLERSASQANSPRGLSFIQTDSTLRGDTWDFLKWSEKEADNIQAALGQAGINALSIKGKQATEESFKQIGQTSPSPRILHISTHGFFFPDPANPPSETRSLQSNEPVFKLSDHPMIRSGLILAGANYAWKTGQPLGNREDGILTAYEISQLDLRNTELVVLSACETGLGHIEGNEGVYGLQRAFKIAGAKTLVMSLWQVPDYQTQELMTLFYQNLLVKKLPVRQAMQAAQKEMRDHGYEPYYWAGFVVLE